MTGRTIKAEAIQEEKNIEIEVKADLLAVAGEEVTEVQVHIKKTIIINIIHIIKVNIIIKINKRENPIGIKFKKQKNQKKKDYNNKNNKKNKPPRNLIN
jgi:hypothetical protein